VNQHSVEEKLAERLRLRRRLKNRIDAATPALDILRI
jgi:hypothetical protein